MTLSNISIQTSQSCSQLLRKRSLYPIKLNARSLPHTSQEHLSGTWLTWKASERCVAASSQGSFQAGFSSRQRPDCLTAEQWLKKWQQSFPGTRSTGSIPPCSPRRSHFTSWDGLGAILMTPHRTVRGCQKPRQPLKSEVQLPHPTWQGRGHHPNGAEAQHSPGQHPFPQWASVLKKQQTGLEDQKQNLQAIGTSAACLVQRRSPCADWWAPAGFQVGVILGHFMCSQKLL